VFYTSTDAGNPALEPEEFEEQIPKIEAKIERVINFGEIILDCGKYHNKLCHAQEYPGIDKIPSYNEVRKKIVNNADVFCLIMPFFENGYMQSHEKMAYICAVAAQDLYNVITFKNYISRKIELYQLKTSNDRYNGFNGLLRRKTKFVATFDGMTVPVLASITNVGMQFNSADGTNKHLKFYSFYQQRLAKAGAHIVVDGLKKHKVPPAWSNGINPPPSPECCVFFKGETEDVTVCIAGPDGKQVEGAVDICKNKMKLLYGDFWNTLRGIKFAEAFHELTHNKVKEAKCKSEEYNIMKYRAEKTIDYAINVDCRYVMNYISTDEYQQKHRFCYKNYGDELKLELKLMSLDNESVYNAINNCVYSSDAFKKVFQESHFESKS
jgi:hypothetical protein